MQDILPIPAERQSPAQTPEVLIRELPPEEYDLLNQIPIFQQYGPPNPQGNKILVVQRADSGELVGFFSMSACVHLDPLWMHPDYRKRPGLTRRLWRAMRDLLVNTGNFFAFAIINDEDIPRGVLSQAVGIGFNKVPGSLYMVDITSDKMTKFIGSSK